MATAYIVPDKSEINKHPNLRKAQTSEASVVALNCLWKAFHNLNRTATKIYSTPGELTDMAADALLEGKKLYQSALVSFENSNSRRAMNLAKASSYLCEVIDHLIDNEIENVLKLRNPPTLHGKPRSDLKKSQHIQNPTLKTLNAILIHHGWDDSQTRRKVTLKMQTLLSKVAKCLQVLEHSQGQF